MILRWAVAVCLVGLACGGSGKEGRETVAQYRAGLSSVLGLSEADEGVLRNREQFGGGVAIDDGLAVVGAPRDAGLTMDEINGKYSDLGARVAGMVDDQEGAVFIYEQTAAGGWTRTAKLVPTDNSASSRSESCRLLKLPLDALYGVGQGLLNDYAALLWIRSLARLICIELSENPQLIGQQRGNIEAKINEVLGRGLKLYLVAANRTEHEQSDAIEVWAQMAGKTIRLPAIDGAVGDLVNKTNVWLDEYWNITRYAETLALNVSDPDFVGQFLRKSLFGTGEKSQAICTSGLGYLGTYLIQSTSAWFRVQNYIATYSPQEILPCGSRFGQAVAVHQGTVLVGAPYHTPEDGPTYAGAAYVFTKDWSGRFQERTKLTADTPQARELFGASVAISGDTIAVGARRQGAVPWGRRQGSVYMFTRRPWGWTRAVLTPVLTASDSTDGDLFGWSIALSGDRLVVGATGARSVVGTTNWFGDKGEKETVTGAAYVFSQGVLGWTQKAKLVPEADRKVILSDVFAGNPTNSNAGFGHSVAMDSDTLLVGSLDAFGSNFDGKVSLDGAVHVYRHSLLSGWRYDTQLTPPIEQGNAMFGSSVAVRGEYALVGAAGMDLQGDVYTSGLYGLLGLRPEYDGVGAVYLFQRESSGWKSGPQPFLEPACPLTADKAQFGATVALDSSVDESRLLAMVGAPHDEAGKVYIFGTQLPTHSTAVAAKFSLFGTGAAVGAAGAAAGTLGYFCNKDSFSTAAGYGSAPCVGTRAVSQLVAGWLSLNKPVAGPDSKQPFTESDVSLQVAARRTEVTVTVVIPTFSQGSAQQVGDALPGWLESDDFLKELNAVPGLGGVFSVNVHRTSISTSPSGGSSDSSDSDMVVLVACAVAGLVLVLALLVIGGLVYLYKRARQPARRTEPATEVAAPEEISMGSVGLVLNPMHAPTS